MDIRTGFGLFDKQVNATPEATLEAKKGKVHYETNIDRFIDNPLNFYKQDDIEYMTANIIEFGLKEPLVVVRENDDLKLISGHRRLKGIKNAIAKGYNPLYYGKSIIESGVPYFLIESFESIKDEVLQIMSANHARKMSYEEIDEAADKARNIYEQLEKEGKVPDGPKEQIIASWVGINVKTLYNHKKDKEPVKKTKKSVNYKIKKHTTYLNRIKVEKLDNDQLQELYKLLKEQKSAIATVIGKLPIEILMSDYPE